MFVPAVSIPPGTAMSVSRVRVESAVVVATEL